MIVQNALKVDGVIIKSVYDGDKQTHKGIYVDGGLKRFKSNYKKVIKDNPDINVELLYLTTKDRLETIFDKFVYTLVRDSKVVSVFVKDLEKKELLYKQKYATVPLIQTILHYHLTKDRKLVL